MTNDDLDRILSREDAIVPSSGFAESVMHAVRAESAAPPPIPFPWKRAVPAMAADAVALIALIVATIGYARQPRLAFVPVPHWEVSFPLAIAVLTTAAAFYVSFRLVRRGV